VKAWQRRTSEQYQPGSLVVGAQCGRALAARPLTLWPPATLKCWRVCCDAAGVRLMPYALASSVAIVPWSVTFVYFGSLSRSLADVVDGHAGPDGLTAAAFLVASGALLIAALAYTTIISRWALNL